MFELAMNSDTLCYCLELAGIRGVHQYKGFSQNISSGTEKVKEWLFKGIKLA